MLDTILNMNNNVSIQFPILICLMLIALFLGLVISITYQKTSLIHSKSFSTALLLLPAIMCSIILLIGNNVAGAFSLAGVFSIIRFRSSPGNSKDIVYILFTVAAGLACGIQVPIYAISLTALFCIVVVLIEKMSFASQDEKIMKLIILIPEDMNDENVFDEILKNYTNSYQLEQMKTKDLGSTYELSYCISIKDEINKKDFIDDLRCRNGNLNISLQLATNSENF